MHAALNEIKIQNANNGKARFLFSKEGFVCGYHDVAIEEIQQTWILKYMHGCKNLLI